MFQEVSRDHPPTLLWLCAPKTGISLDKVNSSLDRGDRNCQNTERPGWMGGSGNRKRFLFLFSTLDITVK